MKEILNELLTKRGCTGREVAAALGVKPATVSDWRTGKTSPQDRHIVGLAAFFGVSVESLRESHAASHSSRLIALMREKDRLESENAAMRLEAEVARLRKENDALRAKRPKDSVDIKGSGNGFWNKIGGGDVQ